MDNNAVIESTAKPVETIDLNGVMRIPAVRQVLLLVGVAASVAAGFAVVLWSKSPDFTQLYSDLGNSDAAQVAEALRNAGIEHKLDTDSGVVLVAESRLHDARLELASQGLPQGGSPGMDMLDEQSSFGVSQFMEGARYQRALEAELSRTISHMGAVSDARVHLAMPRQSAFVRDQNNASASVLLTLYRGRELEPDQASAIVHLVAGSIENLSPTNVTVIDQNGRMLSSSGPEGIEAFANRQFKQTQRVEEEYRRRIEDLLTPLVGAGRVRAQVSVNMDFTVTEETRESFDPARSVVRSEQVNEQERRGETAGEGVPGALSNQPPGAAAEATVAADAEPLSATRSSTRNFEIDRTISRVRPQSGTISRLSVAVLVDDSPVAGTVDVPEEDAADGEAAAAAPAPGITADEIARYEALIKEAVGFDEQRGDSVVVMNAAFRTVGELPEIEEPGFLENPMLRQVGKQLASVVLVLVLGFGLVRPLLRGLLASSGPNAEFLGSGASVTLSPSGVPQVGGGALAIPPPSYDEKVAAAKNITGHDPARVAQVVRKWVTSDE